MVFNQALKMNGPSLFYFAAGVEDNTAVHEAQGKPADVHRALQVVLEARRSNKTKKKDSKHKKLKHKKKNKKKKYR